MTTTAARKKAATAASNRSLNAMRVAAATEAIPAGRVPAARASPISRAWARKPSLGSLEKILRRPAVNVTVTSQASGTKVSGA